ncbi:hypothetical protein, partial [Vibrio metschnikovii]|uniref:hypothetical protein n=1 Tax=Vibrio metschnikovii TaxID=28172 RepID=UPI001C302BAC
AYNKAFKRDSQRVAFLLCVGFCGYSVMRKVGSSVVSPLTRRYKPDCAQFLLLSLTGLELFY